MEMANFYALRHIAGHLAGLENLKINIYHPVLSQKSGNCLKIVLMEMANFYALRHIAGHLAGLENLEINIYQPVLYQKSGNFLKIGQGKPGEVREFQF